MKSAPQDLSPSSKASWPELISELCYVHDVEEPAEGDLLQLEDVLRGRDRLEDVRAEIRRDGLTVTGSKGQARPHPLLATERALERQVEDGLERLWLTPRHRASAKMIREANEITRWQPDEAEASLS